MKTKTKTIVALAGLLALGTVALVVQAQDNGRPPGGGTPNGPAMRGPRPPAPAIVAALDANHDGVIDADEIANAPAALKTLDKNGDGKLTPDEFMGRRPAPPPNPNGGNEAAGPPEGAPAGPPPGQ
ncbi:MAG: EF-hand domain-containing protein [Verrucomicrobiota bacterium]